jgi:putative transposase
VVRPSRRSEMAERAVKERAVSTRLACEMFRVSQSCYWYESKTNAENEQWLVRLTDNHRTWGFGLCFLYLRNVKRFGWKHKRVYRIYRELELNLRIKPRKRLVHDKPAALTVPGSINEVWSMDFMHDILDDGYAFRLFNVLDEFNREALAIEIDFSLPSERVIRAPDQLIQWRGRPSAIRSDDVQSTSVRPQSGGPKTEAFTSRSSGQVTRNKINVNRFNRTMRSEWFSRYN